MTYAIRDSMTMLRRNLRRSLRYPVAPATTMGIPIVLLLLFVFVFGSTLGAGLPGASGGGGRGDYLDYVTPGILLLGDHGRRAVDRDRGRDGHDRGDRRALPHDGDLPRVGAHRARGRQPDPDAAGRSRS